VSPPNGDGYALVPGTLGEIARRLDGASREVEATVTGAPAAPDAGDCTAAVAETLAFLADSLGGVVGGLGSAADAAVNTGALTDWSSRTPTAARCQ
jgi:hypothetical protein